MDWQGGDRCLPDKTTARYDGHVGKRLAYYFRKNTGSRQRDISALLRLLSCEITKNEAYLKEHVQIFEGYPEAYGKPEPVRQSVACVVQDAKRSFWWILINALDECLGEASRKDFI